MPCDLEDARAIGESLPGAVAGPDGTSFSIGERGFVWVYPERLDPKKPRVPNPEVVVIMVDDLAEKEPCSRRIRRCSSPPTTTRAIGPCWSGFRGSIAAG